MKLREYARRARVAVAAQAALEANGRRELAAHREGHGCRSGCRLDESAEYLRLNGAAWEAVDVLPPGTRSTTALDLFSAVDYLLTRVRGARL